MRFSPTVCKDLRCLIILFFLTGYALVATAQSRLSSELMFAERLKALHPDSAYVILKRIAGDAARTHHITEEGLALQQIASIFLHQGNFSQSLDNYLKAGKLFAASGREDLLGRNLNLTGNLYYINRERNLANQYFYRALDIYTKLHDSSGIAGTYGMIGHICEKNNRYDSALHYQRIALGLYEAVRNKDGIADIYENIASAYEDLEDYDSSFFYYNKALRVYQANGDLISQIGIRNNLGDVYRKTGNLLEGLRQSRAALDLARKTNELHEINSAYNDLGKTFNLLGRNDSAYYYNVLSRKVLLEIYTQENGIQIAFTKALYDTEQKNNEIQKLESERNLSRIITLAAIVISILILALGLLIFNRQRLKIEAQKRLNEQEKKVYEANKTLMERDLHNRLLLEDGLKKELEARNREIASHTLHVIRKNQLLDNLKVKIDELIKDEKRDHKKQLRSLMQQINQSFNNDAYWNELNTIFEQVHQSFFDNLKKHAPDLTAAEIRLATLLKINLNSPDIATLLGISTDSLRIARYRLRKKLGLEAGANLTGFIQNL